MKTIEFKDLIVLGYPDKGYSIEIKKAIVGEIIKNEAFDDGTPDCAGYDDYEFTLTDPITTEDIEKLIKNEQPDWSNIRTIHLDKTCSIPRYKVSNFCKSRNIKMIRSEEKADLVLYGKTFSKDIADEDCDYFISKDDLLKTAASLKKRKIPQSILDVINTSRSNLIAFSSICEWLIPKKNQIYGSYLILDKPEELEKLKTPRYYHQNVLLQDMGGPVIDEFTYKRLCQMFDSKDDENHHVAMEIMANCNYGASIVYLLNLMRKYYVDKMYYTKDRDHVSFKALMLYLNYKPTLEERSFNEIIYNVTNRGLLTESNYKLILNMILETENLAMGSEEEGEDDQDNWRIVQVDLSPKYKSMVIWDKKEEPVLEPVGDLEKPEAL